MRASWLPCSTSPPSCMTAILSAPMTVERRWATRITVAPPLLISLSSAACTVASLSASSALVASSRNRILAFLRKHRAIAMRCFCPPLIRTPRSPTRVS
mmetsp:Transcript_23403/g.57747  ORF Transcript_23403/g.57747 Transcript_23403/m.57747 type:complete len:99 (-) Transcript_23403:1382-1678(-)